jgi:hypothetical protein
METTYWKQGRWRTCTRLLSCSAGRLARTCWSNRPSCCTGHSLPKGSYYNHYFRPRFRNHFVTYEVFSKSFRNLRRFRDHYVTYEGRRWPSKSWDLRFSERLCPVEPCGELGTRKVDLKPFQDQGIALLNLPCAVLETSRKSFLLSHAQPYKTTPKSGNKV